MTKDNPMGTQFAQHEVGTTDEVRPLRGAARWQEGPTTEPGAAEYRAPYAPSWVDGFSAWVRGLPGPAWVFYPALGLALLLLTLLTLWFTDVRATRTLVYYYALSAFSQAYLLGLMHYLDQSAVAALARFRPILAVDDAGYERLLYRLSTLPAGRALMATGLGAGYAVATLLLNVITGAVFGRAVLPTGVTILDVTYRVFISGLAALLAYHTIHQLRTVSEIYIGYTRINLFHPGPLYALSSLTARTAIGISIPTYLWFRLNTSATAKPALADLIPAIFFGGVIVVTFVWPLLGAHRRLEREKQRLQDEVARRIEATMAAMHSLIDSGELGDARGALKETLDGLVIEQGIVHRLRTWPWRTETVSGVGAVFLAPLIIWLLQRVLERLGL